MTTTAHRLLATALAVLILASTSGMCLVAQGGPPPPPPPVFLPPVPVPPQNPITQPKAVLGKILFWDEQLSSDNTVACGTCHRPEAAGIDPRLGQNPGFDSLYGTADDVTSSPGVVRSDVINRYKRDPVFGLEVQVTRRKAPSMINAAYAPLLFWDGRASSTFLDPQTNVVVIPGGGALESQAAGPPLADAEMAHENRNWNEITAKLALVTPLKLASNLTPDIQAALAANPTYPALFQAAFGSPAITARGIALAIATYERTLISNQTPFDAFIGGNQQAMTMMQAMGLQIFNGPGRCNICHTGPLTTDNSFRNIGLRPIFEDDGRRGVTNLAVDGGRFKVPGLRNVGLMSTFMHTGGQGSLQEVVDFYNRGGDFGLNQDPAIIPLGLSLGQRNVLVNFLQTALTDPRVAAGTFPFDRPTLLSEMRAPGANLYGAGSLGTAGLVPHMMAETPSNLGNPDFRIGIGNALGNTQAVLGLSLTALVPPLVVGGVPIHIGLGPTTILAELPLQGFGAGNGLATVRFPIPNAPALSGFTFHAQWFVIDPAAASSIAASEAATFLFN